MDFMVCVFFLSSKAEVFFSLYRSMQLFRQSHEIYNNSWKRFRNQHHTKQNKLWNELTICCLFRWQAEPFAAQQKNNNK